jgi:hypothetical protein
MYHPNIYTDCNICLDSNPYLIKSCKKNGALSMTSLHCWIQLDHCYRILTPIRPPILHRLKCLTTILNNIRSECAASFKCHGQSDVMNAEQVLIGRVSMPISHRWVNARPTITPFRPCISQDVWFWYADAATLQTCIRSDYTHKASDIFRQRTGSDEVFLQRIFDFFSSSNRWSLWHHYWSLMFFAVLVVAIPRVVPVSRSIHPWS